MNTTTSLKQEEPDIAIAGILAGVFAGDRLARGSIEKAFKRYEARLLLMPGVGVLLMTGFGLLMWEDLKDAMVTVASTVASTVFFHFFWTSTIFFLCMLFLLFLLFSPMVVSEF